MIFVGEVTDVRPFVLESSAGTSIMTRVSFSVADPLFGTTSLVEVFDFLGGQIGDAGMRVAEMPQFTIGDRTVVFARREQSINQIVGFNQGLLRVTRDGAGIDRVQTQDRRPLGTGGKPRPHERAPGAERGADAAHGLARSNLNRAAAGGAPVIALRRAAIATLLVGCATAVGKSYPWAAPAGAPAPRSRCSFNSARRARPSSTAATGGTGRPEAALARWNSVMSGVSFRVVRNSSAPIGSSNGVNNVVMADWYLGRPFSSETLAITMWSYRGSTFSEADVVFNSKWNWNSYRGALRRDVVGRDAGGFPPRRAA